jgi:hypothetical protein
VGPKSTGPANQPPTADSKSVTTGTSTAVDITLSGSDPNSDPITFSIVDQPTHGQLSAISAQNRVTYTPTTGFNGPDSFTYVARDSKGAKSINEATVSITVSPAQVTGEQTDRTDLSFTSNGYTSTYHLYAGGLDWSKSVGLLIYTDGSGEFGLKNPESSYLLAGSDGMIAVAKKHNMVLLTPLSPNKNCSDGDGSCWYLGDPSGYTKWAEDLVTQVQSQYPIDKKRIAFGGYSSGAQFSTEFWVPSGAAQRMMTDGVIVAITYGGSPKVSEVSYTPAFKTNVHMNWNVGDRDSSYTSSGAYGVKAGYEHYTSAGFQTSLDVLPGVGHSRSGEFGAVMDAQIAKHVPPPTAADQTGNPPPPVAQSFVSPTYFCGGSTSCVPTGSPTPPQSGNN